MYYIQVKHDTLHRKWHKLSVSAKESHTLENDLTSYIIQYTVDNQMSVHCVSGRVIDKVGNVIYTHWSNALINKGN
jgi:hypothetical protein